MVDYIDLKFDVSSEGYADMSGAKGGAVADYSRFIVLLYIRHVCFSIYKCE